jgi:hypothetical protein
MATCAAGVLELAFVDVAAPRGERVADVALGGPHGPVVVVIELVDHLEGPAPVEHVATDHLLAQRSARPALPASSRASAASPNNRSAWPMSWWNSNRWPRARSTHSKASVTLPAAATAASSAAAGRRYSSVIVSLRVVTLAWVFPA